MSLPTIQPPKSALVKVESLLPQTFAPFGNVICTPFSADLTAYPTQIPRPMYPAHQPQAVSANQATALKTAPVGSLINNYEQTQQTHNQDHEAFGLMSIFSSFPRQNIYSVLEQGSDRLHPRLKVGILERHPYTTQTFCPFNTSQTTSAATDQAYMLVIVAPTLQEPHSDPPNPPDLGQVRAFVAPVNHPDQSNVAVTYAPGTWHAPMIVLGDRRVDFLVSQFANGVPQDDCQEVLIGHGPDPPSLTRSELKKRESSHISESTIEIDLGFLDQLKSPKARASKL